MHASSCWTLPAQKVHGIYSQIDALLHSFCGISWPLECSQTGRQSIFTLIEHNIATHPAWSAPLCEVPVLSMSCKGGKGSRGKSPASYECIRMHHCHPFIDSYGIFKMRSLCAQRLCSPSAWRDTIIQAAPIQRCSYCRRYKA